MSDLTELLVIKMTGGIHRQMTALAVTADEILALIPYDAVKITERQFLSVSTAVAHDEILPPADQRIVGTAKGDIVNIIAEMELHRRELGIGLAVEHLGKIRDKQCSEAAGIIHCLIKTAVGISLQATAQRSRLTLGFF